tara:strand:- start:3751 stop:4641 length:891 start_codon:yes stop_codon:yes gene_type:complete
MSTPAANRSMFFIVMFCLLLIAACAMPGANASPSNDDMFSKVQNYEVFMGRWSRLLAPQLIEFAGVTDGEHILDVGTGTGALASALLAHGPQVRVTGIDPSENYLSYADREVGDERAAFVVGDAQAMEFAAASFDQCLSLLVVNFIPDPKKAVGEMIRVTKRGGVIAAAVWDYSDGMQMLRVFWDEAIALDPSADPRDERHMPYCTKDELLRLFGEAGLQGVEATALVAEQRFQSFEEYWAPFLLGTGPAGACVASLPADHCSALRDRLRSRLAKSGTDKPFSLPCRAWAVRGRVR